MGNKPLSQAIINSRAGGGKKALSSSPAASEIAAWIVRGGSDSFLDRVKRVEDIYSHMHSIIGDVVYQLPEGAWGKDAGIFNRTISVSGKFGLDPANNLAHLDVLETSFKHFNMQAEEIEKLANWIVNG